MWHLHTGPSARGIRDLQYGCAFAGSLGPPACSRRVCHGMSQPFSPQAEPSRAGEPITA